MLWIHLFELSEIAKFLAFIFCIFHKMMLFFYLFWLVQNGRFSFDPAAKLGLDIASCILTRYYLPNFFLSNVRILFASFLPFGRVSIIKIKKQTKSKSVNYFHALYISLLWYLDTWKWSMYHIIFITSPFKRKIHLPAISIMGPCRLCRIHLISGHHSFSLLFILVTFLIKPCWLQGSIRTRCWRETKICYSPVSFSI